jgi:hypothetical protein
VSEDLIFSLVQLAITLAGFVGLAMVAHYRIGRLEEQRKEDRAERDRALTAIAEAMAKIQAIISIKSEDAAREHQEFRSGLIAAGIRMDEQRGRLDDHGRRLDDHGQRITRLEIGGQP